MTAAFEPATATIVPITGSFSEQVVASFTGSSTQDVVVNCDMLMDLDNAAGVITAVAWSSETTSGASASFYVEDYNGNNVTVSLPTNAKQPDIVLGYDNTAGVANPYRALVVYCVGTRVILDIYEMRDVGLSTFNVVTAPSPFFSSVLSTTCDGGHPHIDMFIDIAPPSGCLLCSQIYRFGVVWAENGTNDLMGYFATLNASSSSPIPIGTDAFLPDIAGQQEISYSGLPIAQIAYAKATSLGSSGLGGYFPATTDLMHLEWDVTGGVVLSNTSLQSGQWYYPRIEAIGQYNHQSIPQFVQYEIAVVKDFGGSGTASDQVWGFNNLTGGSNLSASQFSSNLVMSPCVAVGITMQAPGSHIGNSQYTVGMYPWHTDSLYTRDVSTISGSLLSPTSWYLTNSNAVNYHWDINKNMAVSSCSNSGDDLLTAWYNGTDIVYKHSQPNVMAFRQAKPSGAKGGSIAELKAHISGNNIVVNSPGVNSYQVRDAAGRLVLSGKTALDGTVNASGLASGNYVLTLLQSGSRQVAKFSKQ